MTRVRVLLVMVLFTAAIGFSADSLGDMLRLGQRRTVELPTPSSTNRGAMLFDLDAGSMRVSDGTTWTALGGSSGVSIANSPYTAVAPYRPASFARFPRDAGIFIGPDSDRYGLSIIPGFGLESGFGTASYPMIYTGGTLSSTPSNLTYGHAIVFDHNQGLVFSGLANWPNQTLNVKFCTGFGSGDYYCPITAFAGQFGGMTVTGQNGANAIGIQPNGTRLDIGTGSNDYFSSNGSRIATPGELSISGGNAVVHSSGRYDMTSGDSSASPGNATINKPIGRSAIASGATSVTITNTVVRPNSLVFVTWEANPGVANFWVTRDTTNGGVFTLNTSAAVGSNVIFSWVVLGAL